MIDKRNLCYPFIIFALCGTMATSNLTLAHDSTAGTDAPMILRMQSQRIKHALNRLGSQDDQEATLAYYRQGNLLIFSITNENYKDKFKGASLKKQARYFQKYTGIKSLKVIVQTTRKAEQRQAFQLNEQKKQRIENHREAEQAKQEAIAQAKAQAKKAKQQAKAKADKKKQAQMKLKKAKQIEQKKKQAKKPAKKNPNKQKTPQKAVKKPSRKQN